jgi:Lon protease-like protein
MAQVQCLEEEAATPVPERHAHLAELLKTVLPELREVYVGMEMQLENAAWVGFRLAEILPIPAAEKQFCLELTDPIQRLDLLSPLARQGNP